MIKKLISVGFILIFLFSCNTKSKEILFSEWENATYNSFQEKFDKIDNTETQNHGRGFVHALTDHRSMLNEKLDSIVKLKKIDKLEVIESYSLGITSTYSMKVFLDNGEIFFSKSEARKLTDFAIGKSVTSFQDDAKYTCTNEIYSFDYTIDQVNLYTNIIFRNGYGEIDEICSKLTVSQVPR